VSIEGDNLNTEFVVNQILFWISLLVSVGAAAGIGLKVATWLRKKVNEDKNELRDEIQKGLESQKHTLENYIKEIATPAAERRDRQEFLVQQIIKRIETIEQNQSMHLQIVLQNQQAIRDFIDKQINR
jgi:hypothetical protein